MDPKYFQGVAVGLTIAWVTSAIAYYVVHYVRRDTSSTVLPKLIIFEVIITVVMFVVAFILKSHAA
jgi:cation transporter-like permease